MFKRVLLIAMVSFTLNALFGPVQESQAEGKGPCTGWFSDISHTMPMDKVVLHTQRTITCAVRRFGQGRVSLSTAFAIADRESHFDPEAYNSSGCSGVFQQQARYWASRANTYFPRGWLWKRPTPFNMRANVIVSIRMMATTGMSDWSI